ncbi:MAG: cupin domain-containing protein [Thermodesulfobacteriota bacterium]
MNTKFYPHAEISFVDHPKYARVKIAALVTSKDTGSISVCLLEIAPKTEIPVHTHDPQVDSIFVMAGQGEAYVNGSWQKIATGDYIFVPALDEHGVRNTGDAYLKLFVHHSPPLL